MGDRGNIKFVEENGSAFYFYGHWAGYDMWKDLQNALVRGKSRWGDEPYLARIIFSELIKDDVGGLTGFGISTYITDNEYPLLIVYAGKQKVVIGDKVGDTDKSYTFEEYVQLKEDPRKE